MVDKHAGGEQWRQGLLQSARDVLETMFFTPVSGECEIKSPGAGIGAGLSFSGDIAGKFFVSLQTQAADNIRW